MIQMVCVDGSNQPIYGDPYTCTNKRKLAVGESLPYHKTDYQGYQISDSYPINDLNGIAKGVQTYFFTSELNTDSLFLNQVHFNTVPALSTGPSGPPPAGYNILGTDGAHIFFSGTGDGTAYWQPWWTSSCQARGWLTLPVATMPIAYGGANSPAKNYPNCTGATDLNTVEWNSTNYTYATGKTIPTAYEFHYYDGYAGFEANYFTEIYGVTRFESWLSNTYASGPDPDAQAACPNSTYTASLHGKTMYMTGCRDWTTIVQPSAPWNPNATSPSDPLVQNWTVDPLYTSTNILQNTHMGGTTLAPATCPLTPWQRSYTAPSVLNWAFVDAGVPFTHPSKIYTCILEFSIPQAWTNQAVYQQQNILSQSGTYSYGAMLWMNSGTGTMDVQVIQRDAGLNLVTADVFTANVTTTPHTFVSTFTMNSATRWVYFVMYPKTVNTGYRFTAAFVNRKP
jgi:hypothetical protein